MASFGVDGVEVGDDEIVVPEGRYRGTDLHDRARRLVGQLPAGHGRGRRRPGPGPRAAPRARPRATPAFADLLGAMGCTVDDDPAGLVVSRDPRVALTGIDVDMADISDLVPTLAAVAAVADDADDDHRRRVHPGQGERPARRPRRRAGAARRRRRRRARRAAHRAGRTAARRRARHPPRPPPGDGVRRARRRRPRHRRRRPRRGVEELAGLLGGARSARRRRERSRGRRGSTCHHGRRARARRGAATRRRRVRRRRHADGGDCVVPFLRQVAGTPRIARALLRPVRSRRSPHWSRRDRDRLKALVSHAAFAGRPVGDVEQLALVFAADVAACACDPTRSAGWPGTAPPGTRTVFVSASYGAYLRPLAAGLGVDGVVGDRARGRPRRPLHRRILGGNCRGPEKVARLHAWLDEHHGGRAAVELWAYGDSAGDRELLADADRTALGQGRRARRPRPSRGTGRERGRRRPRAHGAAAAVDEERPRVRRAGRRRRARPVGRPLAHAARVRRVLPRGQRDLPLERRPRRRGRPHPPDEAPAAGRRRRRARRHRQGRRHRCCRSPPSASLR